MNRPILWLVCLSILCSCVRPRAPISPTPKVNTSIEIPKQEKTAFQLKQIQKTGFSIGYSEELRIPLWVAWELTKEETSGPIPRESNFFPDPDVTHQADNGDYKGSGWSRGHMVPAGDMKWNSTAMHDCCLMTNICPQHPKLNTGAWSKLENKCRNTYAQKYASVYIVCGPIVNKDCQSIGNNNVVVPSAFYKVLLVKTSDTGYQAIGFIYTNDDSTQGMQTAACSVDEVEAITGLDFFSLLPNEIEDAIEMRYDWQYWK